MSIQVVVSSTAAGVSVSGGTAVAITVDSVSASVPVTVGGGIGPAGFIVNPGTASSAFGTFQLAAGDGITISTSVGQFQIASYGTAAVASLAPVQSVAGRVGAVQLQASDVTAGTFAIARIPTISYTALAGAPTSFSPSAHTHSTADVVAFTAAAAAAAPVQSVAGRSGAISLTAADVSGLASVATSGSYTSLSNAPASFAPSTHTHALADLTQSSATKGQVPTWNGTVWAAATPSPGGVTSIAGRTGDVTLAQLASSGTASASTFLRGDGAWSAAGSTDASSLTSGTVAAARLPLATTTAAGAVIIGNGLTIANGVLSRGNNYDPAAAPGAPSGIYYEGGQSGYVRWTASPGGVAVSYELQFTANDGGSYSTAGSGITSTSYPFISGYKFRVRGFNADNLAGEWGYQEGLVPPSGSSSGGGGSGSVVTAATVAGFPATGSSSGVIYVSTDTARAYIWSGAYIEVGVSGGGNDTELRALFTPAAPTSVTATGGNAQATVSWTAPTVLAQTPITNYTVQFSTNSGTTWTTFTRAASTATSATVTGLINGTAHTFRVAAVNGVGTGAYSTASSAVTPAAAPTGVTVVSGSASGSGTNTITATAQGNISLSVPATRTLSWSGSPGQYITGPQQAGFSFDSEIGQSGGWYRNFTGSSFTVIAGTYRTENTQNGATLTFTP